MPSETTFANDPLLLLLQGKLPHLMTQDELREEVNKLRQQRVNAQSLGKMLRQEAAVEAKRPPVKKQDTVQSLFSALGL